MDEKTKAHFKDKFLEHINSSDMGVDDQELHKKFLKPNYHLDFSKKLLDEIDYYDGTLLDLHRADISYFVYGTGFIESFLVNGGFVALYEQKQISEQKRLQREQEEEKDLIVQRKKNKYQAKLAKWQVYTFWPLFFLAIIGGGYSLYQIADKILNPKEVVTMEEFEQFKKEITIKPEPIIKDTVQ